jgi:hypothetical protein
MRGEPAAAGPFLRSGQVAQPASQTALGLTELADDPPAQDAPPLLNRHDEVLTTRCDTSFCDTALPAYPM